MSALAPYTPLQEREIRLLDFGAKSHEPFLIRASLDDPPQYRAVSYCWGAENCLHVFKHESDRIVVTSSLYEILMDLCQRGFQGRLWADMICIDQSNRQDVSQQIPLMAEIYARAELVWAWLGPEPPELTLESLTNISEQWNEFREFMAYLMDHEISPDHRFGRMESMSLITSMDKMQDFDPKPVVQLLNSPWFERVWTFQEAVVASSVVFVVGKMEVPEDVFFAVLMYMFTLQICPENVDMTDGIDLSFLKHRLLIAYTTAPWVSMRYFESKAHLYSTRLKHKNHPEQRASSDIHDILDYFQDQQMRHCTYKADKIYGVLSLLEEDLRGDIPVDINDSIQRVFTKAASAMVKRSLNTLSLGPRGNRLSDLPSWVPDFSSEEWFMPLRSVRTCRAASQRPQTSPRIDNANLDQIRLQGFSLDRVEELVPFRPPEMPNVLALMAMSPDQLKTRMKTWVEECVKLANHVLARDKKQKKRQFRANLHDVFSLIPAREDPQAYLDLVAGSELSGKVGKWMQRFTKATEMGRRFQNAISNGRHDVHRLKSEASAGNALGYLGPLIGRCFFITKDGRMSLGPDTTRSGDSVCIINEAETPFLLRPCDDAAGLFEFVGEAYVHGVMNGESLELHRPEDDVDFILQ